MAKQRKRTDAPRSDYGTPESQQHGEYVTESADVRLGVTRRRRKSLWQSLQDRGAITAEQHAAAIRFEDDFAAAGLIPAYAQADLNRAGGRGVVDTPQRMIDATRRVYAALDRFGADGQSDSRALVWHCVGSGMSIQDYVQRVRWNNRAMNAHKAMGQLQVALDVLASHYGISRSRAA